MTHAQLLALRAVKASIEAAVAIDAFDRVDRFLAAPDSLNDTIDAIDNCLIDAGLDNAREDY